MAKQRNTKEEGANERGECCRSCRVLECYGHNKSDEKTICVSVQYLLKPQLCKVRSIEKIICSLLDDSYDGPLDVVRDTS